MSLIDFQTKYSSFVEGMVRSAINETTKLFETIIDELKAELSKVKKENEEIKTKCNQVEMENKQLSTKVGTECVFVQASVDTRDEAVQCDLVCVTPSITEQPQPSTVNQEQNCGKAVGSPTPQNQTRRESTEEESQMTETFVIKDEESDPVFVSKHLVRDTTGNVPFYVLSVEHCQPFATSIQTHQQHGGYEAMHFLQDHQYCGEIHHSLNIVKQEVCAQKERWHCLPMEQESSQSDDDAVSVPESGNQTARERLDVEDDSTLSEAMSTTVQVVEDETEMDPNGPRVVSVESLNHKYSLNKKALCDIKQCVKPTDEGEKAPSTTVSEAKHLKILSTETNGETSPPMVEQHNPVSLQDAMLLVEAMNQQMTEKSSSPSQAVESETGQWTATEANSQIAKELQTVHPAEAPKVSQKNIVAESDKGQPVILSVEPIKQNIIKLSYNSNPSMLRLAAAQEREGNAQPPQEDAAVSDKPLTSCSQKVLVVPKSVGTRKLAPCSTDPESNVMSNETSSPPPACTSESQSFSSSTTSSVRPRKAYLVSRLCPEQTKEASPLSTKTLQHQMQPVVVIRIPRLQTPEVNQELLRTHSSGISSSGLTTEGNPSPAKLSPSTSSPMTDNSEASAEIVPSRITAPLSEESMEAMDLCESSVATKPHDQVDATETEQPIKEELQAAPINLTPIVAKDPQVPQLHMTKTQFLAQLAVGPATQLHEKPHTQAETSSAPTPTSRKRKSQNTSFVARLRSHLKTHLQEKGTKPRPDTAPETEALSLSPKKARLECDNVKEVSDAAEPVSQTKPKITKEVTPSKGTTPRHLKTKSSGTYKEASPVMKFTWRTLTLSQNAADSQEHQRDDVSCRKDQISNSGKISVEKSANFRKLSKDGSERSTVASKRLSSVKSQPTSQCLTRSGTTFLSRCSSSKENTSPKKSPSCMSTKYGAATNCEILNPKRPTREKSPKNISPNNCTDVPQNPKSDTPRRTSNRTDRDDHLDQMTKPLSSSLKKSRSSDGSSRTECSSAVLLKPSLMTDVSKASAAGSTNVSPKKVSFGEVASKTFEIGKTTDFEALKTNGVLWTKLTNDCEAVEKVNKDKSKSKVSLKVAVAKKLPKAAKTEAKRKYSDRSKMRREEKTSVLVRNRRHAEKKNVSAEVWTPPRSAKTESKSLERTNSPPAKTTPRQDKPTPPHDKSDRTSRTLASGDSPPQSSKSAKHQCKVCGRILCSKISLESHANLHIGQRPFSCTVCSKTFPDSRGLKRHERVHHNNRTYVCLKCGKGFVYQFGLTKHTKMVHTRFKPFVCQICNKAFFTKQEVEAHIRRHTGEKPFHCDQCEKKFAKKVELIVHMRWHNGEKRHWCPYCGKGFLDYNNLKRHKYIHTGEKPHVCPHCQKRFTQSSHVKKHIRNVHKMPTNF